MAKNIKMGGINQHVVVVDLFVTTPTTNVTPGSVAPVSGTPVLANRVPGIAEGDVDLLTSLTPVNTACVAEIAVAGTNAAGNIAVLAMLYISMLLPVLCPRMPLRRLLAGRLAMLWTLAITSVPIHARVKW